ncbi:MAG: MlaE family lipid ABC transporter permease subunit [Novosphingobium sp.]
MRKWADFTTEETEGGAIRIVFSGPLTVSSIGPADVRLREIGVPVSELDLGGIDAIDTVGAWLLHRLEQEHGAAIVGASGQAKRLIAAVSTEAGVEHEKPARPGVLYRVLNATGLFTVTTWRGTVNITGFLGEILVDLGHLIRHPGRIRAKAMVHQLELVGINSLGIIGLMSFLVGIVIAQQGAVQLQQFGAEMLTINLTGRIAMRELGVLMTAIMVAGRSGSAFAAQLGTMKLTEEIDAMRTIGVSPIEALVIPRIMAAVFMMPLLGFYAAIMAIVGGAVISAFTLGIPFMTFLTRIQEVVPIHDVWVGLVKAPFFGLVIAMTGCYQGMQVKANAEEVGLRTTMAVVQAIFMVIVMDAFFAVFFTEVGWG